jgi:Capsule polysaccharide export protein
MGNALYDMKGLTYQGHLNQFWTADFKPDMKLFKKFRGYLLENTQVNAVYYSESGIIFETEKIFGFDKMNEHSMNQKAFDIK